MKKPVIAIDGYSSTGKSSISKQIAATLGLVHLDTGALYRSVTYFGLQNYPDGNGGIDLPKLLVNLSAIHLEFKENDGHFVLYLNGEDISQKIRKHQVSANVSAVAAAPEIRHFLLGRQREIAKMGGVILDGRDIGTVVLPDADYKFFLTANIAERSKRRFLELQQAGEAIRLEDVTENLKQRDLADSNREIAPLKVADDAIVIDNSALDKQQTVELIMSYIL